MKPMVNGNKFYKSRDYVVMEVKGVGDKVYETFIDIEDVYKVISHPYTWRAIEYPNGWVYVGARQGDTTILLHRLVMECPSDKVVDHLHHRTLDNRKKHLRVCTQLGNMRNLKTRYKGISYEDVDGGKWRVRRMKKGIKYDLGFFKDFDEALEEAMKLDEKLKEIR